MSQPPARYFVIDRRPVKVVAEAGDFDTLVLDPATGVMVVGAIDRARLASCEVDFATYTALRDTLREPIIERYATAPLRWELTGNSDVPRKPGLHR